LLARQLLLRRQALSMREVIEHLVAVQGQAPNPPYVGLWTRLETFEKGDLTEALQAREVVRSVTLRGTLHLTTADDFLRIRPLVRALLQRQLKGSYGRELAGLDLELVATEGRRILEARACTGAELGKLLKKRWPERDVRALSCVLRALEPLIHVPPAGTWNHNRPAVLTLSDTWLARPLEEDPSATALFKRYLRAFGPASTRDMQAWSGVAATKVVEQMRDELLVFHDEQGRELFDLPDAPRPDADVEAPVRFLPEWDNILLSHADRSRIIPDGEKERVFTMNGMVYSTVLFDGFVRGIWKTQRQGDSATLTLSLFATIDKKEKRAIETEGKRLVSFIHPDCTHHDIQIHPMP
jgi:hypothetical protein